MMGDAGSFCKRGPEDFKVGVPDNAVRSEGRITLGDYVMITGGGMKRIVHVQAGGKLRLGSSGSVQLDKLAGVRFGEVVYYDPRSRVFVPTNDYPDLDITTLEEHIEDGRDNRHLVDENKSQVLSNEEIAEMRREKGVDVFLNTLVEKSATFHAKTAYSQEKYLRKKKKRYGVLYKIERVTPDGVAETYLPTINPTDVEPESRVLRLRADTLALILHHSDVHSGSRVIVYDKTNGHLEAALLTRLGSDGIIFQIMDRTAQPNMFPSQTMGIENVRELWKAVPRNAAFLRGEEDTENEEKATEKVNKRGKEGGNEVSQWLRGIDARRMLQERPADSLIIVDDEDDAPAALDDLLPFVALNGHIVVHSPFLEDLTALFTKLRGECVNICISEVWCRHHQVLPNRTHPTVRMSTASGYLLTAIKVNESTINCSGAGAPQSPIEEVTPSVPAEVPAVDGRLSRKHPRAQENGEQEGNLSDS
ncbi:Gcd10p family [Trypanosoma brucei equiperdum]|uniref:tRNA (adenine(58)-N(1))-methyltransferase non-catalytic subunit TRM6 n=1 Tax=Trypanosoma brucei equiperdum TaxID=630700 RepID=A0A3L6KW63_9TRYP|nr:Gcd10p family [Trypanosoma brucei equiperdum]